MAELKPCPFCGGFAGRIVAPITATYYECVAYCNRCGAEIRHKISISSWVNNPEREAKRQISRLWNKRAEDGN